VSTNSCVNTLVKVNKSMGIYRYFRENHDGHSNTNAYLLAVLSFYIYNNMPPGSGAFEARFKDLFQRLSETDPFDIEIFAEDDAEVAILSNSRMVLVGFRGTDDDQGEWCGNLGNVPSNLSGVPSSWGSDVRVHAGVYNTLSKIYQSVRNEVRSRSENNRKRVFLTGHSRGAMLATLCAYRFQKVGSVAVAGVYVFGSPRVGNFGFRTRYEKDAELWNKTLRWAKNDDFATKWPDYAFGVPRTPNRYFHVGRLNFINSNWQVIMNHSNPDYEPGAELSINGLDMRNYCIFMHSRLL
jgi:hypothetical protein